MILTDVEHTVNHLDRMQHMRVYTFKTACDIYRVLPIESIGRSLHRAL